MALALLNRADVSGLIGKLSFDHDETLARPALEQMIDALRRRGRGGRAIDVSPGVALGCTDTLHADGRICTTGDAGIRVAADSALTNSAALRMRLQRLGHTFRDACDGEVIAHAIDEWGDRAVEELRGPFAFAAWNARDRRLLLARDHAGQRPLFYGFLPGRGIVFGTEIAALLQDPGVGREWCPAAIDAYLALGYVPAPLTPYRRISKLEPAQRLVVEGRRLRLEQYWDLPAPGVERHGRHAVDDLAERLRSAVRAQLEDGRANGLLFSGGTASAALLPDAAPNLPATVTIALEQDSSELSRSYAATRHAGGRSQIEVATADVPALASAVATQFDEPIADPAAVGQYAVCVAARLHTDDAIAGHGAAALWAGYSRHRMERLEAMMRAWLGAPAPALGELARAVQDRVKGARALSHLALSPATACAVKHAYGLWDDDHRHVIYTRGFAREVREINPFSRHLDLYASRDTADALDRALYVDVRTSLPDSTLVIAEGAAAAAGLRLRYPYLDRPLMELAATMPSSEKQGAGAGMLPLRQLVARRLPASLMPRPYRRPARHPWLRDALAGLVPGVLLADRFDGRGIVSRPALRQLWEEHRGGRRDHAHRLWSLLMLELWFREFIDGDAAEHPTEYALLKVA